MASKMALSKVPEVINTNETNNYLGKLTSFDSVVNIPTVDMPENNMTRFHTDGNKLFK